MSLSRKQERIIWIVVVIALSFSLLITKLNYDTEENKKISDIRGTYEFRPSEEVLDEAINEGVVDFTKLPESPLIYFLIETKNDRFLIYNQNNEVLERGNFKISENDENVVYLFPEDKESSFIEINPKDMSFSYVLNKHKDDVRHFVKISNALTFIGNFENDEDTYLE